MTQYLTFLAKDNLLVSYPGTKRVKGSPARYVGRRWNGKDYEATKEGDRFLVGSPAANRLLARLRKDACLIPGDAETAQACGLPLS